MLHGMFAQGSWDRVQLVQVRVHEPAQGRQSGPARGRLFRAFNRAACPQQTQAFAHAAPGCAACTHHRRFADARRLDFSDLPLRLDSPLDLDGGDPQPTAAAP